MAVNANTSVDQFAGLRSDSTPFYRARFEHVLAQGDLSVVLDDVRFSTPVPEPSSAVLLGCGIVVMAWRSRRMRFVANSSPSRGYQYGRIDSMLSSSTGGRGLK